MGKTIFREGRKYTFSDYFEMGNPTEEIVGEFGYSFQVEPLNLPLHQPVNENMVRDLRESYYLLVPKVSLNSEAAKRELMIAPIFYTLLKTIDGKLNIEYPIYIDDKLSGAIDYLLRSRQELIVIEAKKGDLERGFNQLAVEMIAIDKYEPLADSLESDVSNYLYGAITIGEVWRFAILERKSKKIKKDVHTYRFPEDVENILAILNGILG